MKHCFLIIFFMLSWRQYLFCQQPADASASAVDFLQQVEERYELKFSYTHELIENLSVSCEIGGFSDEETLLTQLEKCFHLKFEQVRSQYVLIRPFEPKDQVEVCGIAVDQSGAPVSGLLVHTAEGKGVITDSDGKFTLQTQYDDVLTLDHLSFNNVRRKSSELFGTCPDIIMKPAISMLEELVVQEYITEGMTRRGNQIKIDTDQLDILPGLIEPDILQSIQLAPGVSSPFETASSIYVRGGAPDQNLVLWNGIKTYNQGHLFGMLSAFNPYITKQIKFIKDGTSALYGGRVSSVIDMQSSREVPTSISGGAGFNMLYADAYFDMPLIENKLSFQLSGRRSYTDFLETPTYAQISRRVFQNTKIEERATESVMAESDFYFNDFTTGIVFKPYVNHSFFFNSFYSKNDLDFSDQQPQEALLYRDLLKTENEGYSLQYDVGYGNFSLSTTAFYSAYSLLYEFVVASGDTADISSKKNLITESGLSVKSEWKHGHSGKLITGYEYNRNHTRYAFEDRSPSYHLVLDQDDRMLDTHAGFLEEQLSFNKTQISLGTRLSYYHELNKAYVEPRAQLRHLVAKPLIIRLSGEYRTQPISEIKESIVSDLSLENQVWTLATPDRFPVIESYQLTGGLSWEDDTWQADIDAYIKELDGVTTLTFGFLNPVGNDYLKGNSSIYGIDFFLKKNFERYKSWLSYTYLHTQNHFTGLNSDEPFPGNWNIEHQVKWSHFYHIDAWKFSLGWLFHTGKAFTNVETIDAESTPIQVIYSGINKNNLPLYHRMDISVLYEFKPSEKSKIRYRMGLSVLNVYNRRNLLNREFRITPTLENELLDTRVYSLGITPNLVFRIFW